jgi:hypothetical protein
MSIRARVFMNIAKTHIAAWRKTTAGLMGIPFPGVPRGKPATLRQAPPEAAPKPPGVLQGNVHDPANRPSR